MSRTTVDKALQNARALLAIDASRETQVIMDEIKSWGLVESEYGWRYLGQFAPGEAQREMIGWKKGLDVLIDAIHAYLAKPEPTNLDLTDLAPATRWRILHMIMKRASEMNCAFPDNDSPLPNVVDLRSAALKLSREEL